MGGGKSANMGEIGGGCTVDYVCKPKHTKESDAWGLDMNPQDLMKGD